MADKTISDLEQIAELTENLLLAIEGGSVGTSSVSLGQLLDFLHPAVQVLQVSGASPNYTLNPVRNIISVADLSGITSSDTVNINLPTGLAGRESQVIVKIKNPNTATIRVVGLTKKISMYDLTKPNFQLILDYDQAQGAWVGGTLPIEEI